MGKGQNFYQIRHIVDTNVLFPRCFVFCWFEATPNESCVCTSNLISDCVFT